MEHIKSYQVDQSMHNRIYQETQNLLDHEPPIEIGTIRSARVFDLVIEAKYSKVTEEIGDPITREKIGHYFRLENFVEDAFLYLSDFKTEQLRPYLSKYGINNTQELYNHHQLNYYDLIEKNIISYPELKKQFGTVELDQLLFDLGIKTAWALTALEDLFKANKKLQLELMEELNH